MVSAAWWRATIFCMKRRFRFTRRLEVGRYRRAMNSAITVSIARFCLLASLATVACLEPSPMATAAFSIRHFKSWLSAAKIATGQAKRTYLEMAVTQSASESGDHSIVNPGEAQALARGQHLHVMPSDRGWHGYLKPGKNHRDFRPGTPLDDTLSILIVPPKRDAPPQSDLLQHYFSMILSKCYRSSGGRLSLHHLP